MFYLILFAFHTFAVTFLSFLHPYDRNVFPLNRASPSNLTHPRTYSPAGLQFANQQWGQYVESLKPIGFNLLVNNTCKRPEMTLQIADHSAHIDVRERGLTHNGLTLSCFRSTTLKHPCMCRLAFTMGEKVFGRVCYISML